MSNVVEKQITEAESKLVLLLREVRNDKPAVFERVQLWIARMCSGKKLSDFLHEEKIQARDRLTVARSLVDILLTHQFDRLPELTPMENGNAPAPQASDIPPSALKPQPPQVPAPASPPQITADPAASSDGEREMPAPDELRAMIRREVRYQIADLFERMAKVLKE